MKSRYINIIKVMIIIILPALLLGACAAYDDAGKGRVYWLNYKAESDETLQKVADLYEQKTGVRVKVMTAASGTYDKMLNSEMDKAHPPTIIVLKNKENVDKWADCCVDLTDSPIARELDSDSYNVFDKDKRLVAIGYCYECFGIIANPSLLEKAGYSVNEIKNFESLKRVAEDIHDRSAELGFDAFTSCDLDDSSAWRFTGHMANLEYYYEARDAGGWDECPASIKGTYMDNYKNLYDLCINNSCVPPESLATGGHDAENEFMSEKAAFYVNGSWEYEALSKKIPDAVMLPYYCGVEGEENAGLNCGTENYWAVNSRAKEQDIKATLDFMYWCVTDETASRMLVDSFGVMPYKMAADSNNAFLSAAQDYAQDGCYVMDWDMSFQPNAEQYRAGLVSALDMYNSDQSEENWRNVCTAFVQGWEYNYREVNAK